jgi:hypothetical protein
MRLMRTQRDGKRCCRCKTVKPLSAFYRETRSLDGHTRACKPCSWAYQQNWRNRNPGVGAIASRRWRNNNRARSYDHILKVHYGLPLGSYDEMYALQDGRCAICKKPHIGEKRMNVDHCHDSGQVRGLLCRPCNLALGHFGHDIRILHAAIRYLDKLVVANILADRAGSLHPACKTPD